MRFDSASWSCRVNSRGRPIPCRALVGERLQAAIRSTPRPLYRPTHDGALIGVVSGLATCHCDRGHQRGPPVASRGRLCRGPYEARLSEPRESPNRGIAVDRSFCFSVEYRHLPRAVLLISAVTNREHTYEAHSNIPILASSPDVWLPDPYAFLAEASAADPHLISSFVEEPLPLPPVLQAARFWSKLAKPPIALQAVSFHRARIKGRPDRLCSVLYGVPVAL
jgi:hypothetical protein